MNSSPERGWIDISRPLSAATACWPGDVPYSYSLGMKISDGASVNVGAITTSLHTATHCDAPYHYQAEGMTVDQIPLEVFLGPAHVVNVSHCLSDWIIALQPLRGRLDRLLIRTGGWPVTERFPERIPVMEKKVVDWLKQHGTRLLGLDLPSVDQLDSKDLPIHHALGDAGITIVEGLWLEDVPEGEYDLIAAPIKVIGTDGGPLRALVRSC